MNHCHHSPPVLAAVPLALLAFFAPHAAATNGGQMLGLSAIQNGMAGAPGNQAVVTTKQFFEVSPGFAYQF